ncbi:hypothetical protein CEQ90_16220 [Lewinellaceae bacterium SD302]|nr:hypothetical protein CEQ90_16220 [Lewinellaceae bacterium SD302]
MRLLVILSSLLLILLSACDVENEFVTGDGVNLRFEVDTLRFDTVFTDVGSATRFFKVYNEGSEPVQIDRIELAGMTGVRFDLNVDGTQGPVVEDVIIWENDSIYVFVEVTVDPTAPENVSPFVVEDQVQFTTGERVNPVLLEAFGQNANYRGVPGLIGLVDSCIDGRIIWTDDLPYVVYGAQFVNECILEMQAGTRVYMHGGVARNETFGIFNDGFIFVLEGSSIEILGTREEPVIIQTDRLEERFQDEPGQYLGIILGPNSVGNRIEHAQLLHGIQGIVVDSLAELEISNTRIAYTLGSAISGRNGTVLAENCLFHDNFGNTIQFIQGARLRLDHCTLANYGTDASALVLQNFECFDEECENFAVVPVQLLVRNSIIAGSRSDELRFIDGVDPPDPLAFQVEIINSVVRVEDLLEQEEGRYADFFETLCQGCYNLQPFDPLFLSLDEDDYHLDTLSVAEELGQTVIPGLELDLEGIVRMEPVDAGALEREEN